MKSTRDPKISAFDDSLADYEIPARFTYPFDYEPHALSLLAAGQLQKHLEHQEIWDHNFGLSDETSTPIGKMFGVLVVLTEENDIGYLSAFSGKLAGENHHEGFVPPIFDGTAPGGFLNVGMTELTRINQEIDLLQTQKPESFEKQLVTLKNARKAHSVSLQSEIFDQYHFLNHAGEEKSLVELFKNASYKNPPAGAGECAAPKLLQYAFQNQLKPLSMAEFWWGSSPKSDHWKHGKFYPACQEKCAPILAHMLSGMDIDAAPEVK